MQQSHTAAAIFKQTSILLWKYGNIIRQASHDLETVQAVWSWLYSSCPAGYGIARPEKPREGDLQPVWYCEKGNHHLRTHNYHQLMFWNLSKPAGNIRNIFIESIIWREVINLPLGVYSCTVASSPWGGEDQEHLLPESFPKLGRTRADFFQRGISCIMSHENCHRL